MKLEVHAHTRGEGLKRAEPKVQEALGLTILWTKVTPEAKQCKDLISYKFHHPVALLNISIVHWYSTDQLGTLYCFMFASFSKTVM